MRYKIGIFGSAINEKQEVIEKAKKLGNALGKKKVIVINGACDGIPYIVAHEAYKNGAQVWGYSPEINLKKQKLFTPNCDLSIYTKLDFIPEAFSFASDPLVCKKYRNVISTASCDAGIIISGRWGTMNEFTNLYDMGKIIGVLTGTGGIADELPSLCKKISKKSKAKVIFDDKPNKLISLVFEELSSPRMRGSN